MHERFNQLHIQGRYSDLQKLAKDELVKDPTDNMVLAWLGFATVKNGNADGISIIKLAISKDPKTAFYFYLASKAFDSVGKKEKAVEYILNAIELDPDEPEYYAAHAGYYIGNWQVCLELCDKALEVSPRFAKVKALKAIGLFQYGKKEEAKALLNEALADDPEDTMANSVLGIIAQKNSDYHGAKQNWELLLKNNPSKTNQEFYLKAHSNKWFDFFTNSDMLGLPFMVTWIVISMYILLKGLFYGFESVADYPYTATRIYYYAGFYSVIVNANIMLKALSLKRDIRRKLLRNTRSYVIYGLICAVIGLAVYDIVDHSIQSLSILILGYHLSVFVASGVFTRVIFKKFQPLVNLHALIIVLFFVFKTQPDFILAVGYTMIFTTLMFIALYGELIKQTARSILNLEVEDIFADGAG